MKPLYSIEDRVAGITFYNEGIAGEYRQSIVHDMKVRGLLEVGQRLQLQRDPANLYDRNAVAVLAPDGRQIGFVPRTHSEKISLDLKNGKTFVTTITDVLGGAAGIGYKLMIRMDCYDIRPEDSDEAANEETSEACPAVKVFLQEIHVKELYGIFSYTIDINNDITLLHAMNGGGKTTILRILSAIVNHELQALEYIPLEEFTLSFSNGAVIQVLGNNESRDYRICFQYPAKMIAPSDTSCKPGEALSINDPQVRSLISFCTGGMKIKLISANRLFNLSANESGGQEYVTTCANKINTAVANAKDIFTQISETLDSSFLYRVMENIKDGKAYLSYEECNRRNAALEEQRDRYAVFGLVNKRERHTNSRGSIEVSADTNTDILHMITTYIRDGETKNQMIADVYERICLLLKLINEEHAFCRKKLVVDFSKKLPEKPISFVATNQATVPLEHLSSGEKNDFILFAELVFDTNASTLVLIDEPEISLHPAWQLLIVDELMEIGKLNRFQTIVATHSPTIVGDHMDKMVGLEV